MWSRSTTAIGMTEVIATTAGATTAEATTAEAKIAEATIVVVMIVGATTTASIAGESSILEETGDPIAGAPRAPRLGAVRQ
mmetsp:Transcript_113717/g.159445  ORF Transcript_113717/g.159445 Transcript_113717/m.159445 type:complete len:81 (+) Transcript_113717:143-385(+)